MKQYQYTNPIKSVSIQFDGAALLTIHHDGRVTTCSKLNPSETAALVLDQIKTQWMNDSQAAKIRELQDRIKRLEEVGDKMADMMIRSARIIERESPSALAWLRAKEDKL